jgi:argininosuccinate lyase
MPDFNHNQSDNAREFNQVRRFWQHPLLERTLLHYDVLSSIAHVRMLGKTGIVDAQNAEKVVLALEQIGNELSEGLNFISPDDADIHEGLERRLNEIVGEMSAVLRIAKSTNDQDATDVRLWLRDAVYDVFQALILIRTHLTELAKRDLDVVMPGYTHMQPALPILLGHWWLANEARFRRDFHRLADFHHRLNVLPLGACVLAGTPEPIDRKMVADELGFDDVIDNSVDAVSDRDFVIEFGACASLIGVHLSQMSSELLLWATQEFGFVKLPRRFVFDSSTMPSKRNPELLEVLRSRPATLFGRLMEHLTQLKAIPLGYSQDLQESLPGLFQSAEIMRELLNLASVMIPNVEIDAERMREMACADMLNATNAKNYLVSRDIPEDKASKVMEALTNYCKARGKYFSDLSLSEWQQFSPAFENDIYQYVTMENSVASFCSFGGSSREQVEFALSRAAEVLTRDQERVADFKPRVRGIGFNRDKEQEQGQQAAQSR